MWVNSINSAWETSFGSVLTGSLDAHIQTHRSHAARLLPAGFTVLSASLHIYGAQFFHVWERLRFKAAPAVYKHESRHDVTLPLKWPRGENIPLVANLILWH